MSKLLVCIVGIPRDSNVNINFDLFFIRFHFAAERDKGSFGGFALLFCVGVF